MKHESCNGARCIKEITCLMCGKKSINYSNGVSICKDCSDANSICSICGSYANHSIQKESDKVKEENITMEKSSVFINVLDEFMYRHSRKERDIYLYNIKSEKYIGLIKDNKEWYFVWMGNKGTKENMDMYYSVLNNKVTNKVLLRPELISSPGWIIIDAKEKKDIKDPVVFKVSINGTDYEVPVNNKVTKGVIEAFEKTLKDIIS